MNSQKRMIRNGLLGAAVGLAAGLLLAPKSGRETRKDIVQALTKIERELKSLYKDLNQQIDQVTAQVKKATGNKSNKELADLAVTAKDAASKVKELLTLLRDGQADEKEVAKVLKDGRAILKKLNKQVRA